jgi:PKD repeat protein
MSPLLKRTILCVAGLSAACRGDLSAPNLPPVAAFGSSCTDLACTFSDSSSDTDGRIAAYHWSFGDASADETTRDPAYTYAAPGTYTVVLTVTDDDGATASVVNVVQPLLSPNAPPVAHFGSSCVDLTCIFGDSSSDADGTIVSHHWTFGDGEDVDAPSPAHTYASGGAYRVQLAVTDDRGATTVAEQDVTVTPPAPGPAIALSDSSIVFCYAPGSTRNCVFLMEDILITSTGGKALNWTASSNQPWLNVSPATGKTPTQVRISVDTRKLPPRNGFGVRGAIRVSAKGAANSPQAIPVSLSFVAIWISALSGATVLHSPAPTSP